MNGYSTREQAEVKAQEIGGEVVTAYDGSYLARGDRRASDRSPYYAGADFAGYLADLGAPLETLLNGAEAAQSPAWWTA